MMNQMIDIPIFIIESLTTLLLLFIVLRFLLQTARADFYNPLSQGIVKFTNPMLLPLRKVIPGFFGIDIAAIVLAVLVQVISGELIYLLFAKTLMNPLMLILWGFLGTIMVASYIFLVCILIIVVSSFIAPHSTHPGILLANQLVSPILQPIQKIIPSMGGLDFSVFFMGMGIYIAQQLLTIIAQQAQLPPALIIGF